MDVVRVVRVFLACYQVADSLLAAHAGSCSTLLEGQHRLLSPM